MAKSMPMMPKSKPAPADKKVAKAEVKSHEKRMHKSGKAAGATPAKAAGGFPFARKG